jgi:Arabinose efflux permease
VLTIATVAVTVAVFLALRTPETAGPASRRVPDNTAQQQGSMGQARGRVDWRAVLTLCGVSVLLVTAHFISYTYFALVITEVTGTSSAMVMFLAIFGVTGAAGTCLIGRYLDIGPRRAEIVTMTVFGAALATLSLTLLPVPSVISYAGATVAVAAWGLAFAATGPIFQTGILRIAPSDADRASSVYVTGVQIGIASGSALGALLISLSTMWLPPVSTLLAIVVLLLLVRSRPTQATTRRARSIAKAGPQ